MYVYIHMHHVQGEDGRPVWHFSVAQRHADHPCGLSEGVVRIRQEARRADQVSSAAHLSLPRARLSLPRARAHASLHILFKPVPIYSRDVPQVSAEVATEPAAVYQADTVAATHGLV